jgi:hypothetical protein
LNQLTPIDRTEEIPELVRTSRSFAVADRARHLLRTSVANSKSAALLGRLEERWTVAPWWQRRRGGGIVLLAGAVTHAVLRIGTGEPGYFWALIPLLAAAVGALSLVASYSHHRDGA